MKKICSLITILLILCSCNSEISVTVNEEINGARPYSLPFTQHRTSFDERCALLQKEYNRELAPNLHKYEDTLRTVIKKHLPPEVTVTFDKEVTFTYIGVSNGKIYGEAELYKYQKGIVFTALIVVGEIPLDDKSQINWTIQPRGWIEE